MITFLENINELGALFLLLSGYAYLRHLKKTKWDRKLTKFEVGMYIIVSLGTFLYAGSLLLIILGFTT